ncbi:MAG: alpha-amylase family glycosyl hydrolase [Ruminococcus sp.]|nr:alpha-amylase family glycosyl hydrolase [Ruminococcus sp.]
MKIKRRHRAISAILSLCLTASCTSFAFTTANAVTKTDNDSVSAIAGSVVEDDGFTWDNATVYFLLTDRFKNGNTSNDHSYNRGLNADGSVANISDTRATFHGGDFAGVTQEINSGYFENLGVNALWISAPYEQIHGYIIGSDAGKTYPHYSYHGYYVLDYSNPDANFGTAEEFQTMVDTAHEHGIRVILDIVLNHAGYNSLYDMAELGFGTITNSSWSNVYYNYNGISSDAYHGCINYNSNATDWGKWWGADWVRSGVAGYTDGSGGDLTKTLEGLPDFKTESSASVNVPTFLQNKWSKEGTLSEKTSALNSYFSSTGKSRTVTNYISYWLSDWVRKYGVDGFRCDTAKHVEYASWKNLKQTCVDALKEWRQKNPTKAGANWQEDFWMTGEAWDHGLGYDGYYSDGGFDSMINFSTCGAGALASSGIANVYQDYADKINTQEGFNGLSFISSHDELLVRGDTNTMNYYGSAFLLLPGAVQIFYGDETSRPSVDGVPFDGYGKSGHSLRGDMNWNNMNTEQLAHWQKVGTFRNNHVSVGAGANIKLSASNGVGFGRTYDKNGVTDKVAGVIGASSNTSITLDVSALWPDGQNLVNAYDDSSSVVSGGKVTFNSGAYGTILVEEPDGRPLMSVIGNAKFKGSQTVTVNLEGVDSAKASIDGGNKFVVYNGSTFEIGSTGYDGDTITVTLEATNENGTYKTSANFVKTAEEVPTQGQDAPTVPVPTSTKLYVKSYDGSAPFVYAWTGSSTAQLGAWPGTRMTEKSGDYYVIDIPTTSSFNVVLNNGSGTQSKDITNLKGDTYLEITSGGYEYKLVSSGGGQDEPYDASVTVYIKPYNASTTYYLYAWDNNKASLLGAWPGTKLSNLNSDGYYTYTFDKMDNVNIIVNKGSGQGQTDDITGVKDGAVIEVTNDACTSYKLTELEIPVSGYGLLRKEAREVLAMSAYDYTSASWSSLVNVMTTANAIIAMGDGATDEETVQDTITKLQQAKANLVLAQPALAYAVTGNTSIAGFAVPDSKVVVTVDGATYNTKSDDVTGQFTVTGNALKSSSTIKVNVSRNSLSSDTFSYSMSKGNITIYTPPTTTSSTIPTGTVATRPTTQTNPTATTGNFKRGDVNLDNRITVNDSTQIQQYLVQLITLNATQLAAADADKDGNVSIKDATLIQKYLVDLANIEQ